MFFLCIAKKTGDKAIDFNFIYEEVKNLYSDKGRSGNEPVSLFKNVFIQYQCGIATRAAFFDVLKNLCMRFADTDIFERIFKKILEEAQKSLIRRT